MRKLPNCTKLDYNPCIESYALSNERYMSLIQQISEFDNDLRECHDSPSMKDFHIMFGRILFLFQSVELTIKTMGLDWGVSLTKMISISSKSSVKELIEAAYSDRTISYNMDIVYALRSKLEDSLCTLRKQLVKNCVDDIEVDEATKRLCKRIAAVLHIANHLANSSEYTVEEREFLSDVLYSCRYSHGNLEIAHITRYDERNISRLWDLEYRNLKVIRKDFAELFDCDFDFSKIAAKFCTLAARYATLVPNHVSSEDYGSILSEFDALCRI